jgi:adenylate kinase
VQRDDDTPESVDKRLALYNEQTAPLLAWFAERSKLIEVDGVGDPQEISKNIIAAVADHIATPG